MDDTNFNLATGMGGLSAEDIYAGMNQMKTGMAIYDENLNLIFANKTIRSYLPTLYANLDKGFSMRESISKQAMIIYPMMSHAECEKRTTHIYDMIQNSGVIEVTTPSGLKLNSAYDQTSRGDFIVTTTDVTDRVNNEKALTEARINADAANAAKTDFLANMSHEIRTPLSGVSMAAQLLQRQLRLIKNPELTDLADILVESTDHLNAIITDVLNLSKIEAGQIDIKPSPNSLREQLLNVKKSLDSIADEKGLDLKLVIDSNLPERLIYDPVRVRQCLNNLISNALKFTDTGSVTIAGLYDAQRAMVTIYVVDTGTGIPLDEQTHVFDHYAQSKHNTPESHKGTGLGLAISRKLARMMNGDITLVSKPDEGSAFTLTFASKPVVLETENLSTENLSIGRLSNVA